MKYTCPRCNRMSIDGNLWCQERYCPAENALEVFDKGEWFSNIEIVKLVTVLRSSTIYEARRGKQHVLLKVANAGCQERLKREAVALLELSKRGQHHMLPTLLPAHEQATVEAFPYGRVNSKGKEKYFEVFAYADGDILRDLLLKNPQPWYQHAGWLTISLADAVMMLHQSGRLHLCLSPEIVLVRYDRQNIPRPMLLDLGVASAGAQVAGIWDYRFCYPAYTAPELATMQGEVGPATDVYGLGAILYEMLAGRPAYDFNLKTDEEVFAAVVKSPLLPAGRTDLKNIPQIAERSLAKSYSQRPKDVLTFARELQANSPAVPHEKKGFKVNWRTVALLLSAALAISLLLAFSTFVTGG